MCPTKFGIVVSSYLPVARGPYLTTNDKNPIVHYEKKASGQGPGILNTIPSNDEGYD